MKNLLSILLFCPAFMQAQVFPAQSVSTSQAPARGGVSAGGTYQAIGTNTGQIRTIIAGTVTAMPSTRAADTLKIPATSHITGYAADSGYVFFSYSSKVDKLYELTVTTISGTLAGSAILQGSKDGQIWHTITGNTTYCAGCVGASASLSGAGTTTYQWSVPVSSGDIYAYHQMLPIVTGTCTATFSGTQTTAY